VWTEHPIDPCEHRPQSTTHYSAFKKDDIKT